MSSWLIIIKQTENGIEMNEIMYTTVIIKSQKNLKNCLNANSINISIYFLIFIVLSELIKIPAITKRVNNPPIFKRTVPLFFISEKRHAIEILLCPWCLSADLNNRTPSISKGQLLVIIYFQCTHMIQHDGISLFALFYL